MKNIDRERERGGYLTWISGYLAKQKDYIHRILGVSANLEKIIP